MDNPLRRDLDEVISLTQDVWPSLDGASIFLTGGTGFYGCWLLESFAWAVQEAGLKASVEVLTRSPETFYARAPHLAGHPNIRFVEGDIRTYMPSAEESWTHVIHAATEARAASTPVDAQELSDVVQKGTLGMLSHGHTRGAKRFLLASSGAVYGRQPLDMDRVSEHHPPLPNTLYGETKFVAERHALGDIKGQSMQPVIARGFAFLGPHLSPGFAVSDFLRDGLSKGVIRVAGDGTAVRSYLYASDLAVWLWRLLVFGKAWRVYNVGSDRATPIRELAFAVQKATGASEVKFGSKANPAQEPERYVPDVTRIQAELGVKQTVSLEEGLDRTVEWMRNV